jgi:hypothetical protein
MEHEVHIPSLDEYLLPEVKSSFARKESGNGARVVDSNFDPPPLGASSIAAAANASVAVEESEASASAAAAAAHGKVPPAIGALCYANCGSTTHIWGRDDVGNKFCLSCGAYFLFVILLMVGFIFRSFVLRTFDSAYV